LKIKIIIAYRRLDDEQLNIEKALVLR